MRFELSCPKAILPARRLSMWTPEYYVLVVAAFLTAIFGGDPVVRNVIHSGKRNKPEGQISIRSQQSSECRAPNWIFGKSPSFHNGSLQSTRGHRFHIDCKVDHSVCECEGSYICRVFPRWHVD